MDILTAVSDPQPKIRGSLQPCSELQLQEDGKPRSRRRWLLFEERLIYEQLVAGTMRERP
jgi:hypothetical protein